MTRITLPGLLVLATVLLVQRAAPDRGTPRDSLLPRPAHSDSVLYGIFEGRTPCGAVAVDFTGFPAENCEKIKWQINLYRDSRSADPTTFVFKGTRSTRRGTWSVARGAADDPDAVVYRLGYAGDRVLSLLRADDNVLLVLDGDLRLLVGDASWSYTLSRTSRSE
jgi:hypothetical protein